MNRLFFALAAALSSFLAGAGAWASPDGVPPPPAALELYVGQAHVLDEGDVRRIVIGNGKVIQATALDDRQVLIIPEAPGQSTLHLWGRNGTQRSIVVNVIPADAARLIDEIRAMLGSASNVRARVVGDKVVVEGGNLSDEQAGRLAEVSKRYPQIVNLVSRVGLERMIAMDVKMVEIRRDQLENLGVRWSGNMSGPAFGIAGDLHRSGAMRPGGIAEGVSGIEVRPRLAPFVTSLGIVSSLTSMINLMVQNGDAAMLAEPSLSCRSGGSAKFVAGGELPIPFTTGLGNASVMFKEYGVKFDVSPVASESGVIAAKIATEISAVNFEVMVKDVPGLTKRRAETEVNLREHETLVIAGLLSEESSHSIDRLPALGELPVLGRLFRSRAFRDRQTELVVFITPRFADVERPAVLPAGSAAGSAGAGQADAAAANPAGDKAAPLPAERLRSEPVMQSYQRARNRVRMVE
jgi:Flp pilus assembly secretin CpaC